jgi:hypothetical protein
MAQGTFAEESDWLYDILATVQNLGLVSERVVIGIST